MRVQHQPRIGRSLRPLLTLLLVLGLTPQPVAAAGPAPLPGARIKPILSRPAPPVQPPVQPAGLPDSQTAPQLDCSDPTPGIIARLRSEDEVLLSYRYSSDESLHSLIMDSSGQNLINGQAIYYGTIPALSQVREMATTAADLNGDGKAELVSANRDKSKRIATTTNSTNLVEWYADSDDLKGDNLKWVSLAAGDLDRSGKTDELAGRYADDEVALAFEDDNNDIRVMVLDGNSAGQIGTAVNKTYGAWNDPKDEDGRGKVAYVAVATGDINGDGYNDEIATVFRDGNNHLQLLVLRRNPDGSMTALYKKHWTNHLRDYVARDDKAGWANRRPIAVATGDVDGDMRDEIVIGFRAGDDRYDVDSGLFQLMVVNQTREITNTNPLNDIFEMDDQVYLQDYVSIGLFSAANSVSVAVDDLDGNGRDEIALGYSSLIDHDGVEWQQHLKTYAYVGVLDPNYPGCTDDNHQPRACLVQRSGHWDGPRKAIPWRSDEAGIEAQTVVATGDLDQDGKAEIALARRDHDSGDVQVYTFDADNGLHARTPGSVQPGANHVANFWLAMGDTDGNSWYGKYDLSTQNPPQCRVRRDAQIQSVIHAPPFWPGIEPNEEEARAKFSGKISVGNGLKSTVETTLGGSVTYKAQVKEIGPSFTYEYEKGWATETENRATQVDGFDFETGSPKIYDPPWFGAIGIVKADYNCYKYKTITPASGQVPDLGEMEVCLPHAQEDMGVTSYSLQDWYEIGPEDYRESWVPVGIDLAYGRTAIQSSTNQDAAASRAVDGNTNGAFKAGSVSHTEYDTNAWWQVDLGGVQWLDGLQIWNRTDCCTDRLTDFYVFVSDAPFASNNPADLLNDPDHVWSHHESGQAGSPTVVAVGHYGRYVRVQLAGKNYLHMAEVQVYGMPGAVNLWPTRSPITSTTSFTLTWPGGLQQPVPGEVLLVSKSPSSVDVKTKPIGWMIGSGVEGETMKEDSTASKFSFGMELRLIGGEISSGVTQKTAYILSWSKEVEFEGTVGGELPSADKAYKYLPFVWLQRAKSSTGTDQAYLVLDYYVPPPIQLSADQAAAASGASVSPMGVAPQPPLIESPTHPDPATWSPANTVRFDWAQPPGDPAVVDGYDWQLDRVTDTVPAGRTQGLITTQTFVGLADGVWHMHVRAGGNDGQWGVTTHRTVRIDANAPQVTIQLDPPFASGHSGWYVTPVTVNVTADDGTGSGVAGIEVSPDGITWQPYTGPMVFDTDTAGTTVYARATDVAGQVSSVLSSTFQIDRSTPDSHVAGGQGPGVFTAEIITNSTGNQELLLTGAIADLLSGGDGMGIQYDGADWTTASLLEDPALTAGGAAPRNWTFSGGHTVGAGYHIFYGRAQDAAGNTETPYEIGRVLWFPQAAPNLSGSSMTSSHTTVRPGEALTLTLTARNGGPQEAFVAMTATLPAGMTLITDTLAPDVVYDPGTGLITWPAGLLWPGAWVRHSLAVRPAAGLPATTLVSRAILHAFWPNSDLLPPDQRQRFLDNERTQEVSASVAVNPSLPASATAALPWATLGAMPKLVTGATLPLNIVAAAGVTRMYLREWTLDPSTGDWLIAQDSGWINYSPNYTWTLSSGQGVKYLGVWVADAAANLSVLDEGSLAFVNRGDGDQTLANGQRIQFRGDLELGAWIQAVLTTVAGDPDMYVWRPHNNFWPDIYSNDSVAPGQTESLGGRMVEQQGVFLLEVQAVGDSTYNLSFSGEGPNMLASSHGRAEKIRPQNPLTLSDPLSANQVNGALPRPNNVFMPSIRK